MRPDLTVCTRCTYLCIEPLKGPSRGDFAMFCSCSDDKKYEEFERKRKQGYPVGHEPEPIHVADFVRRSDREYRVRYAAEFYVPSHCPYATEQLIIQDSKGLIK